MGKHYQNDIKLPASGELAGAMCFYVTLVSDRSKLFLPKNKISHFITQLPFPINLNMSEWEEGLIDLTYPHSLYNVRKDSNLFGFALSGGKLEGRRVPPGCNEAILDFINGMTIASPKNIVAFAYHLGTKRMRIAAESRAKVILHEGLSELLGFEPRECSSIVESPYIADPFASFPMINVYSDIS